MSFANEFFRQLFRLLSNFSTAILGRYQRDPTMDHAILGSPSSDTSDGDNNDPSNHDIISVFQILIRNGQIHIMSSEESDDDEYTPRQRRIPALSESYEADLTNIEKNDIKLKMENLQIKERGFGDGSKGIVNGSLPQLLASRELGNMYSLDGGFSKPYRHKICNKYLPNTCKKIANFGYKVFCGRYSQDGNVFLSASQDRIIRVFDTSNGRFNQMKKINARDVGWAVLDVNFSPDGRYLAYSSWSESIHLCNIYGENVETHESLVLSPENNRFCIFSLVFSEDGNEILGGGNDGFIYVYDRERGQRILKIYGHEDDVNSVAFVDESSNIMCTAGDDGVSKVWDRRLLNESDPKPVGHLAGHLDGITYIDPKGDGRYLITNSKDQSIKLWDIRVFSSQETVTATKRSVSSQHWDYRWQNVPKRLCVARTPIPGDTSVLTYRGHGVLHTLIRCHFSPLYSTGQRYIVTGCASGRVVIYDLLTGSIVKDLHGHSNCVRDVSWSPFSQEIVSSSFDNSIGLWSYEGESLDSDPAENILDEVQENPRSVLRRSARLARNRRENPDSDVNMQE